jgi:predicted ferric reductase
LPLPHVEIRHSYLSAAHATIDPVQATTAAPATRATTRADHADRAWIVAVIVAVNALVIAGMWLRHGGIANAQGPGAFSTAIGQLTGLFGAYAVLIELLLMSRIGWVERYLGLDHMAVWHRWNGFAAVWLLVAHTVFITLGYAASNQSSFLGQTGDFIRHYPDVLMAFAALALFIAVAATSARVARRELRRETWHLVHLYAYLAVALGFAHQLAVGSDFVNDPAARVYWVTLYVAVAAALIGWRVVRPVWLNAVHALRVERVVGEAPGVVSIHVAGRRLDELGAQPGQFFLWRFLTRDGWFKAHPFSLSAPATRTSLRFTVKNLGDETAKIQHVRPGTRLFAEGPYGTFTPARRTRRKVLLIAGGIGITPLRAMVEAMPAHKGEIMLLYRVVDPKDAIFENELRELTRTRGIVVHIIPGSEIGDDNTDLLSIPALHAGVPGIASRDCYVCGPPAFIDAVRRRLARLGVPRERIHFERFEF